MALAEENQCTYEYEHLTDVDPSPLVDIIRPVAARCPHAVANVNRTKCLFHFIDDTYPVSDATEAFLGALNDKTRSPTFTGAYVPGLALTDEVLSVSMQHPLDLRGAIIDGDLDLTGATINIPILLDGATVRGDILAKDATFEAPVSLAGTVVSGGIYLQAASIDGGVVANELDARYLDWRGITIDGPLVFDSSIFTSSLKLARGEVSGTVSFIEATVDWHIDATGLSVGGDILAGRLTVDGDLDFVGTHIDGKLDIRKSTVGGEAAWDHASIGGNVHVNECSVGGDAGFDDMQVHGGACTLDNAEFTGKADFASLAVSNGQFSATNAVFRDEVWFTHAVIEESADLSGAVFEGQTHLRDAEFRGDLYLNRAKGSGQTWMAGSTIHGAFECTAAQFGYFQFSATVHGNADFEQTNFTDKAVFTATTCHGRVWFDEALFAGVPDFSKARFTGHTSFDGTVFLVEPTFDEARFAADPDFKTAEFPTDLTVDPADRERQWQLVLVHPDSLINDGLEVPLKALSGDFSIPASVHHLIEDKIDRTKAVNLALSDMTQDRWSDLVDRSLRTARTAVTRLENTKSITLVFGVEINAQGELGVNFLQHVTIVGAYEQRPGSVTFGHLDPALKSNDYLIPVPADDAAFDSGAAVATRAELQQAMLRHERLRLAQLGKPKSQEPRIHKAVVPVLVAAGHTA
jgi:uncharacterized protein YjbI with pentapeptide repeats